ncbi:hypothetical protein RRG08_058872 [Elysia crispata]|uniref:Uncharacterized protein n=1 Tax=Elysia crispata TaxID=231223 RepID=A0AAE0Y0X9_9GAST|nr:hypothetical protein RRG08_058872 [Elysia crispata]
MCHGHRPQDQEQQDRSRRTMERVSERGPSIKEQWIQEQQDQDQEYLHQEQQDQDQEHLHQEQQDQDQEYLHQEQQEQNCDGHQQQDQEQQERSKCSMESINNRDPSVQKALNLRAGSISSTSIRSLENRIMMDKKQDQEQIDQKRI